MVYNDTLRNAMIENGLDVATMGNGTFDAQWPTCVGCAILNRSLNRTGTAMPDVCTACFQRYCWNGTINATATSYDPELKLSELSLTSDAGSLSSPKAKVALGVAAAIAMFLHL